MTRETFCAYPWFNLNTTPQGNCKLCCNIVDSNLIGHGPDGDASTVGWGTDSIHAIWNGDHMQAVRGDMLSGRKRTECGDCHRLEDMGLSSPRTDANQRYASWLPGQRDVVAPLPTSLELRLSTRCNLACTTCWSGSSDMIQQEQLEQLARSELPTDHHDHLRIPHWLENTWRTELAQVGSARDNGRYSSAPMSLDNFATLAPTLRRLYVTGGEPTMDSNVIEYLRLLRDHGNTACHVSFTTNGTLWNDKLMNLLSGFDNAEVQISIDGHEDANDWIRHHSSWLDVIDVIDRYFGMPNLEKIVFYTVISAVNAMRLEPLLRYLQVTAQRHGKKTVWTPIMLQHPQHLRVSVLPSADRVSAADSLERWFVSQAFGDNLHPLYCGDGLSRVLLMLRDQTQHHEDLPRLAEYMRHTQLVRLAMLRSFAESNKISVDDLEKHGYIRPRQWTEVFPELAGILEKVSDETA